MIRSNKPEEKKTKHKQNNKIERTGLIFDKVSFVLPLKDYEDGQTTVNALATLETKKNVRVKTRCHADGLIVLALIFKQERHALKGAVIQIVASAARNYLRIEFNPSKVNKRVYQYLDLLVQNVTYCNSLSDFCVSAHISRLDVCYDIKGFDIRNHLFTVSRFQKNRSWVDGDIQIEDEKYAHETIVFGASAGNTVAIYDKAKQSPESYPHEKSVMRVEYRLRPLAYTLYLTDLPSLKNNFPRVQIFSATLAQPPSAPAGFVQIWRRSGFRMACRLRKTSYDLSRKILKECVPARWLYWQSREMKNGWAQDVENGLKACGMYELMMNAHGNQSNIPDRATQKDDE